MYTDFLPDFFTLQKRNYSQCNFNRQDKTIMQLEIENLLSLGVLGQAEYVF